MMVAPTTSKHRFNASRSSRRQLHWSLATLAPLGRRRHRAPSGNIPRSSRVRDLVADRLAHLDQPGAEKLIDALYLPAGASKPCVFRVPGLANLSVVAHVRSQMKRTTATTSCPLKGSKSRRISGRPRRPAQAAELVISAQLAPPPCSSASCGWLRPRRTPPQILTSDPPKFPRPARSSPRAAPRVLAMLRGESTSISEPERACGGFRRARIRARFQGALGGAQPRHPVRASALRGRGPRRLTLRRLSGADRARDALAVARGRVRPVLWT